MRLDVVRPSLGRNGPKRPDLPPLASGESGLCAYFASPLLDSLALLFSVACSLASDAGADLGPGAAVGTQALDCLGYGGRSPRPDHLDANSRRGCADESRLFWRRGGQASSGQIRKGQASRVRLKSLAGQAN
jgi:hypothetical protein